MITDACFLLLAGNLRFQLASRYPLNFFVNPRCFLFKDFHDLLVPSEADPTERTRTDGLPDVRHSMLKKTLTFEVLAGSLLYLELTSLKRSIMFLAHSRRFMYVKRDTEKAQA
ncbi:uncharacterized protein BO80DRAFT_163820 [Aspergillus ibericus CBS 121593]|uniref:Uncharacterized protein n=1 Tax=Aspergillus ibericus CBS 121593 TaxID=1448316 RepID=A0A395GTC7_9EURO|nr:hypothetical protein BO80DRAFT_163820 [Aspergillus ibericus CBS 121593]RAK98208.1 hypothetical protein BO80DRAFT_163820 [Aspergillus ibericus CBS 121593]